MVLNTQIQKILQIPDIEKISINALWLFIDKIIKFLVSFLVMTWAARYLGPQDFGILSYGIAFIAIFLPFSSLGLNTILVKEFVDDPDKSQETLVSSILLRLFLAIICFTVILIIAFSGLISNNSFNNAVIILLSLSIFFQSFDNIDYWFQSKFLSKYTVYAKNLASLISSAVKISLIIANLPLIYFAASILFEYLIGAILLYVFYVKSSKNHINFSFYSLDRIIKLLKISWPILFSSIGAAIYFKIDQIMLGSMTNSKAVGYYSVAVNISEMWFFLPTIICTSMFPMLIKAKEQGGKFYTERFQDMYDLLAGLAYIFIIPVAMLSPKIIDLLYGPAYNNSAFILSIHIWSSIFVFLRMALSRWLVIENLLIFSFISYGIGALLNILLNLFLIPMYSGVGASIATLISYGVASIGASFIYPKTRHAGFMMVKSILVPLRVGRYLHSRNGQ